MAHVLTVVSALLCVLGTARADETLARNVPGDVGLFVEARQADDLLIPLTEPRLWLTLAELAGQPGHLQETAQWSRRIEQTIGMKPTDAIHTLFSQRVAFVAAGLRETPDAVVLCRPDTDTRELVRQWNARPLPTARRTSVYRLPNNIGVALHKDLLIFGDGASQGMFEEVLEHNETTTAASLASHADFRRLLGRVPPNPDGLLFARLQPLRDASGTPVRQPLPSAAAALGLPIMRGSRNVLLALHRDEHLLHFSAVGDATRSAPPHDGTLGRLVASLPEQTLLTWAGHVDYKQLKQAASTLPERSVFRIALNLHEHAGTIDQLTASLNSMTCIAIGAVFPQSREVPAPPVPAVAILIDTHGAAAAEAWSGLLDSTLAIYKLLALKLPGAPRLPAPEHILVAGLRGQRLDLSATLGPEPQKTALGELELSWVLDGETLIIATHTDWLRQIIASRQERKGSLAPVLELGRRTLSSKPETVFVAQTGPVADLGNLWLRYFEQTAPHVLREDWWRTRQPGGTHIRLGIQVTADAEARRLRVRSITKDSPADGFLQVDDVVLGCNRRRFATSQPVLEIRRGLAARPNARWIDLYIERDRVVHLRRIPLPFVDPVEILQRVIAGGKLVQRVVYFDDVADVTGPRGYLTLEMRTREAPLFDFPLPAKPSTRAATVD